MSDENILERVQNHFNRQCGQEITIPEWDLTAVFDPLTLAKRAKIKKLAGGSESRQLAYAVILALKTKEDNNIPVFKDDIETLTALESNTDPQVIGRVAQIVMGINEAEDLKN